MKKIRLVIILFVTVCVGLSGMAILLADSAEAKTVKLSAKSVTIAAGGKQTISLSSGYGEWSIEDDSIARLKSVKKKSVVVVPKHSGTTSLICNVGKKRLQCKVKVLNDTVGDVRDDRAGQLVVGSIVFAQLELYDGDELSRIEYDKNMAKISIVKQIDNLLTLKLKTLQPGTVDIQYFISNGEVLTETVRILPGFRGKTKVKKSKANYNRWRKNYIKDAVASDMTTWEIIDTVGYLISSGSYSSKGGASGIQLWYGGNGTCVSGAKMMNDFMHDIGVSSKVRFAGNDGGATDIYGNSIMYMTDHKNTQIQLGGKKYILSPQPGMGWPMGIIDR